MTCSFWTGASPGPEDKNLKFDDYTIGIHAAGHPQAQGHHWR